MLSNYIKLVAALLSPILLTILAPFGITGSTTVDELITLVSTGIVTTAAYFYFKKK